MSVKTDYYSFPDFREMPSQTWKQPLQHVISSALENLKIFWYNVLYLICRLISESNKSIFEHSISLIPTHNYAKRSELADYVKFAPLDLKNFQKGASFFGLENKHEKVKIKPMDGGKCLGAVIHFFKSIGTDGVENASKQFEKGMPFKAAIYQSLYSEHRRTTYYPEMKDFLIDVINKNGRLSNKWTFGEKTRIILEAVQEYLREGNHPARGGLLEFVKTKCKLGPLYGTLRCVEEHFTGVDLQTLDHFRFAFALAALLLEPICYDVSPSTLIGTLTDLSPGRYNLNLSTYNFMGRISGYHATGFVINDDNTFDLLDPNSAIGKIPCEHLRATIERTIAEYTGIFNFEKKGQSLWRRVKNFLLLNPNASPTVSSGFSLHKVTEANL